MRAVNLLPPDSYAPKQRLPHAPLILGAMLPVLAGALVFLGWSLEHSKVVERQNELAAVETSIAALRPTQALRDEATRIASERSKRALALTDALAKQMPWDVALAEVSRVLPSDVWLSMLTAASPTPAGAVAPASASTAPGANPTSFTIQGYTFSHDSVARLLERLALVPSLSDVALSSTSSTTLGSKPVIQFNVQASLNAPSSTPGLR
ncbi:MAG: PilN domain-containing protein [Actinobacteria bacterium]|nr:PilN domain-containing protein [Actinomycetota bacterium]